VPQKSSRLNLSAVEDFMIQCGGLTRRELAGKIDKSESYLSEILSGKKPGSSKVWHAIAEALGVRLASILIVSEEAA